jgi:SAM-dependent methyltransferase
MARDGANMCPSQRIRTPEIMDGEDFTPAELEGNIADLTLYARLTGTSSIIERSFDRMTWRVAAGRRLSVLDVGAGSADAAAPLGKWARRRGFRPGIVAADISRRMIEAAKARNGGAARLCVADARRLPYGDGSFDLACSSLVLHHLDDRSIETVLNEMKRVTRLGFVVVDLRRSSLALLSVWALTRLTSRNRLTLNDGPLSVRRSLTIEELQGIAARSGLGRTSRRGVGSREEDGPRLEIEREGMARLALTYAHRVSEGARSTSRSRGAA